MQDEKLASNLGQIGFDISCAGARSGPSYSRAPVRPLNSRTTGLLQLVVSTSLPNPTEINVNIKEVVAYVVAK